MAKKLLLDALTAAIGDFVEGISEENLKVGIWSGKVSLSNVALNVSKIKEKDLPVCIYAGSCASLELSIPWTALATQPVKVLVSGVNLLAGPLDPSQITANAARQRASDATRAKLDAGDRVHQALLATKALKMSGEEAVPSDDDTKDPGWAASLVMKIVDNIQVTVESVHVRYEQIDTTGTTIAAGVTLDGFTVRSTNGAWEAVEFQTRTKGQRELYKLLRLASCALYLDPDCQSPLIAKASAAGPAHASSAVGGAMRELIARSSRNENDPTGPGTARGGLRAESYLVAPLTLEVRACRNERPRGLRHPALKLSVSLPHPLTVDLRRAQYREALMVTSTFAAVDAQVNRLSHLDRPRSLPQPGAAKKHRTSSSDHEESSASQQWWQFMAFRMLGQSPTTPAARVRALRHRLAPHPSSVPSTQRVVSLYEALVARLPDKRKSFPDLDLPPLSAPSSDHHSGGQGDDWANIGSSSQPKKVCNAGGGPGDTEVVMLGGSEMSLLAEIEAALPLEVSRAARQRVLVKLSMDEVRREAEAKQKAKAEKKQQSSKGGWFSGWGKSKSSAQDKDRDEAEDDVDVEELVKAQGQLALNALLEGAASAADEADKQGGADATDPNLPIPTVRLSLDASATFQLWAPPSVLSSSSSSSSSTALVQSKNTKEEEEEAVLMTATARLQSEVALDVGSGAWDAALQLAGLEVLDRVTPTPTFPALFTTHAPSSHTSGGAAHGTGGSSLGAIAELGGAREGVVWDNGNKQQADEGDWAEALVMGAMAVGPVLSMPIEEATDVAVGVRSHPKKGISAKVRSRSCLIAINAPLLAATADALRPPPGLEVGPSREELAAAAAAAAVGAQAAAKEALAEAASSSSSEDGSQEGGASSSDAKKKKSSAQVAARYEEEQDDQRSGGWEEGGGFSLDFKAGALRIVLPVDCSADRGALLLDPGALSVCGGVGPAGVATANALNLSLQTPLSSSSSSTSLVLPSVKTNKYGSEVVSAWKVQLASVNARLATKSELFGASRAGALLEPFDLNVALALRPPQAKSGSGGTQAGQPLPQVEVWCGIAQPIMGELSPHKLTDLLFVLLNLGNQESNNQGPADLPNLNSPSSTARMKAHAKPHASPDEQEEVGWASLLLEKASEADDPSQQALSQTSDDAAAVDPFAVTMALAVSVPGVKLLLTEEPANWNEATYAPPSSSSEQQQGTLANKSSGSANNNSVNSLLELAIEGLSVQMLSRSHDSSIAVEMAGLHVHSLPQKGRKEGSKDDGHFAIVSSGAAYGVNSSSSRDDKEPATPLVRISVDTVANEHSPLLATSHSTAGSAKTASAALARSISSMDSSSSGSSSAEDEWPFVGMRVKIGFSALRAAPVPSALRQLQPFYAPLVSAGEAPSVRAGLSPEARLAQAKAHARVVKAKAKQEAQRQAQAQQAAKLQREREQRRLAQRGDTSLGEEHAPSPLIAVKRLSVAVALRELSLELMSEQASASNGKEEVVPVARAAVRGLLCNVAMGGPLGEGGMIVDVNLRTLVLEDARPEARHYFYRHLIAPQKSSASADERKAMAAAMLAMDGGAEDEQDYKEGQNRDDDEDEMAQPLLQVRYTATPAEPPSQETSTNSESTSPSSEKNSGGTSRARVECTLTDFKSFVIVPSALAALDSALDFTAAVQDMIAPVEEQMASEEAPKEGEVEDVSSERSIVEPAHTKPKESAAAASKGGPPPGSRALLSVGLEIVRPSLVAVADPSKEESAGIVLEAFIRLDYKTETTVGKADNLALVQSDMVLAIEHLEAFVNPDMRGQARLHVLDPLGCTAALSSVTHGGVSVSSDLHVDMDEIACRVSHADTELVKGVLNASAQNLAATNEKRDALQQHQHKDSNHEEGAKKEKPSPEPTSPSSSSSVSTLAVSVKLAGASMELIDDTGISSLEQALENDLAAVDEMTSSSGRGASSSSPESSSGGVGGSGARSLIRLRLAGVEGSLNGTSEPLNLRGNAQVAALAADFFNFDLGAWEVLVEEWPLEASVVLGSGGNCTAKLTSNAQLSATVSTALAATALTVASNLGGAASSSSSSRSTSSDQGAEASLAAVARQAAKRTAPPFKFVNYTGVPFALVLPASSSSDPIITSKQQPRKVNVGSYGAAPFALKEGAKGCQEARKATGKRAVGEEADTDKVVVQCAGSSELAVNARKPVAGISLNRPHGERHALVPIQSDLTTFSSSSSSWAAAAIPEEVWQYQRRVDVTGQWKAPFMPGDPFEWSDRTRSVNKPRESVTLPPNDVATGQRPWVWLNDWSVEPVSVLSASLGDGPGASSVTDPHGWEYGTSFDALSQRTFKGERAVRRDVDTARRRRWTRVRAPIPPPLDDPNRPLSLFLEVARGSGGATEVRASSGIRVENHTGAALEIGCESAAWLGAIIAAGPPVKPSQTCYLPLHLIDTMRLALREVSPQSVEKSAAEPQEPAAASKVLAPALREALATVAAKAKEGVGQSQGGSSDRALVKVAPGEQAQSSGPLQRAVAGFGAGLVLSGLNPVGGILGATVAANAGGGGGDEDSGEAVTTSSDAVRDGWPVDKIPLVALESTFAVDRTAHLAPVAPSSANARLPSPYVCFSYRLDDAANSLHQAAASSGSGGSSQGAGAISSRDRARCLLTVEVHAPVVICNKLPCSLDYCLGTSQVPLSTVPAIGQGISSGKLLPGGEAKICRAAHWRDPSLGLALKIGKYHWKGLALGGDDLKNLLEQGRRGEASLLEMEDGFAPGLSDATQQANNSNGSGGAAAAASGDGYGGVNSDGSASPPGRTFAVSVLVTEPSQGRILVEVFARHWIVDRSGLGLTCGGRKHMMGFQPKQPGSVPCGKGVSSLQTLTEEASIKNRRTTAAAEAGNGGRAYEEGWALGEGGLSLLRSSKDHLMVALPTNTPLARPSLDPRAARSQRSDPACSSVLAIGITTAKADNVFSMECGERSVELCYEVTQGVGVFENSKVVRICPRFAILNPDPRATLLVRQEGTSPDDGAHVVAVPPRGKAFYHWSNAKGPKRLLVKFMDPRSGEDGEDISLSTAWSFGGVNIEAIGATPLWVPPSDTLAPSPGAPITLDAHTLTVVQVEVQLADDHQDSASNVLIERLPKNKSAAARFGPSSSLAVQAGNKTTFARAVPLLAAQNDTKEPLVLRQGAQPSSTRLVPGVPNVRWVLQPGESMVFGWLAPAALPKEVWATVQAISDRSSTSSSGASLTGAVSRVLPSSLSGSESGYTTATDDDGGIEFDEGEDDEDGQGSLTPPSASPSAGGGGGIRKSNSEMLRSMGQEFTSKVSKVGSGGGGKMKKAEHCFKMLEMAGAGAKPKRLIAPDSGAVVSAAAVVPVRGTRLLLFAPTGRVLQAFRAERSSDQRKRESRSVSLEVALPQGVGLSVVDDYGGSAIGLVGSGLPAMRREVLYLVANGVNFTATHDADAQQSDLVLQVRRLQLDNLLRGAPFPVALAGRPQLPPKNKPTAAASSVDVSTSQGDTADNSSDSQSGVPFLSLTVVVRGAETVPYLALRLLPLDLMLDMPSVNKLLKAVAPLQTLANGRASSLPNARPALWARNHASSICCTPPLASVDVEACVLAARGARLHFMHLEVHPIVVLVTFLQNAGSEAGSLDAKKQGVNRLREGLLLNMASVSRSPVRLNCFTVVDAIEATSSIAMSLQRHYLRAAKGQLLKLAGSMAAFGNPVDLASNVGGGVQDLFYEPMQGAVAGPKEFIKGVGRGGKGFVSGVVHGVSSSVAGVTGTVNKQLGMLAFDDEYAAARETKLRNQADASREGNSVQQGFRDAGENVLGGFTSGIGGLFKAPVQGAKKEGVGGFFKGVGRGVAGLVVKPVMGVSEGVTSLVTTVSDVSDAKASLNERPAWMRQRRAIPLRPATNRMVIVPYDELAASAQANAVSDAPLAKNEAADAYVDHVLLPHSIGVYRGLQLQVVVTWRTLFLKWSHGPAPEAFKPQEMTIQWGAVVKALPLAENCVSLAFFQPNATLQNLGFPPNATLPGTTTPALVLRCPSSKDANALYALMWSRRELMADPRGMPDPQHKSSSENPLGSGNGSEEGWTCPVCTLHNASPLSLACEACGSVKPHNNNTNGSSGGGGSSGSGSGSGGGGEVYAFGTANTPNKMGVSSAEANLDERKLLEVSKKELSDALSEANRKPTMTAATKANLDGVAWKFCRVFTGTHSLMSSKRVAVLLFLNESLDPIQVGEPHLRVGQACHLLTANNTFNEHYRTLAPGGALMLVAWSFGPSPFKKQHVVVSLSTSAADVNVSDMRAKTGAAAKDGFVAGVMENSQPENKDWAKVVVSIAAR